MPRALRTCAPRPKTKISDVKKPRCRARSTASTKVCLAPGRHHASPAAATQAVYCFENRGIPCPVARPRPVGPEVSPMHTREPSRIPASVHPTLDPARGASGLRSPMASPPGYDADVTAAALRTMRARWGPRNGCHRAGRPPLRRRRNRRPVHIHAHALGLASALAWQFTGLPLDCNLGALGGSFDGHRLALRPGNYPPILDLRLRTIGAGIAGRPSPEALCSSISRPNAPRSNGARLVLPLLSLTVGPCSLWSSMRPAILPDRPFARASACSSAMRFSLRSRASNGITQLLPNFTPGRRPACK